MIGSRFGSAVASATVNTDCIYYTWSSAMPCPTPTINPPSPLLCYLFLLTSLVPRIYLYTSILHYFIWTCLIKFTYLRHRRTRLRILCYHGMYQRSLIRKQILTRDILLYWTYSRHLLYPWGRKYNFKIYYYFYLWSMLLHRRRISFKVRPW